MKKLFLTGLITAFFFSCSNNKSTNNTDQNGPGTTNVQNVNGNVPDTTTGIRLNGRQPVDSTRIDSVSH